MSTYLFALQDSLIEHKFPLSGTYETLISDAGDIYREISKQGVDLGYIGQKMRDLERATNSSNFPLNEADFDEIRQEILRDRFYKSKRNTYMKNLEQLKRFTMKESIDSRRKTVMLSALRMIEALVKYFEGGNPYIRPSLAFSNLNESVKSYFSK
jgi:hypothetical protein